MHVKGKFKIHGLDTANGLSRSANTSVFYETYDEALRAAQHCIVGKGGWNTGCNGIVIYQAIRVVLPRQIPTIIEEVD